ncbi:MAG: winged helix-turn-helix domain-containing protein [Burkholderiales bacterium]|nr:winged helix-turn-helix domain-containing protein [Burkholderiales bacterium]
MPRRRPQLAKLSRPRLHAPVPRERLFRLLDELRSSPVVWVEGPPGSGKTTTIATYLDAVRRSCLWYQFDDADSDPATFFHYLHEAAGTVRSSRPLLPRFTPEHSRNVPAFARRFFRTLFERLPPAAAVVFDNYQEVAIDSPVQEALACAAEEVPQDANIIVLSRVEPPKALARARASNTLALLTWEALRLTVDEIRAIAAARGDLDQTQLEFLHRESQGWAAGVVLMLERFRRAGALDTGRTLDGPEATFDYFASQIFDSASVETREILMTTALFPAVTVALAEAISGNAEAGRVLELLHRRRLFVDRRAAEEITYQYHALFHTFLRHRAAAHYNGTQFCWLVERAGHLLCERRQEEEAFPLYCEAQSWNAAAQALSTAAPSLIGQGRLQTVEDWVHRLPQSCQEEPGVAYWMGMALEPTRPDEAREWLQRAYERYVERGDSAGQLLSAAGVLDTLYVDFSDFVPMRLWIERLTHLLEVAPGFASPEMELRVQLSLIAAVQAAPDNRLLAACAARVETLLAQPFDVNLKAVAGQRLLSYGDDVSDLDLCRRVAKAITPLLSAPQLTPANAANFLSMWGYHLYISWRVGEALASLEHACSISQREGLHDEEFRATAYRAVCLRRAGQLAAAEAALTRLEALPKPRHGVRASLLEIFKAMMSYSRGDLAHAIEIGIAAQEMVDASGNIFNGVVYRVLNADILIADGQLDRAARLLSEARQMVSGTAIDGLRAYIALNQAHLAHARRDPDARDDYLRETLALARTEGGRARLRWFPCAMSALFPVALREGIEPELVRTLIREFSLPPPSLETEDWPWPVKVFTLGRFEVWCEGQQLSFDRKAPRKTLALLQALIAFGGLEVAEERLLDALWPDDDGDAAHRSLTQALHRLRKLLGDSAVIRQSASKLSLDLQRCWIDALAFERLLDADEDSGQGIRRAIDLYRGPFLMHEDGYGWAVAARERLRACFIDSVEKLAAQKEQSMDFEGAIDAYRRGLAADELVEPFYQGLMRCYRRLDRRSDAARAYQRLRQKLFIVLGTQPSAATERIYREL